MENVIQENDVMEGQEYKSALTAVLPLLMLLEGYGTTGV